ncbi:MAG: hypothetical protein UDK34_08350 [Cyanobacteriota bacterium]|nr:hypothetical protein [Cyanobacteriota bacterium]
MGMSASQARLLTITARLADNELRSQTINNAKMRLSTQSAQASDNYINALNDANMMFSNYDLTGTSQSQLLTYNALTSYSSYNNQYGLVSSAGQLLVSESEAAMFKAADGNVNAYLKAHGLEYTTTYFDNIGNIENTAYPSPYNLVEPDKLKEMYEAYNSDLTSSEYKKYETYYSSFVQASEALAAGSKQIMRSYLMYNGNSPVITNPNGNTEIGIGGMTNGQLAINFKNAFSNGNNTYGIPNLEKMGLTDAGKKEIEAMVNSVGYDGSVGTISTPLDTPAYSKDTTTGVETISITDSNGCVLTFTKSGTSISLDIQEPSNAEESYSGFYSWVASSTTLEQAVNSLKFDDSSAYPDDSDVRNFKLTKNGNDYSVSSVYQYASTGDFKAALNDLTESILDAISGNSDNFNYAKFGQEMLASNDKKGVDMNKVLASGKTYLQILNDYTNAKDNLLTLIEGTSTGILNDLLSGTNNSGANKGNTTISVGQIEDIDSLLKIINQYGVKWTNEFSTVIDKTIIDQMIDKYGEPKYAWVDETDSTNSGNADAKAQWYTNMFNRMKSGYKTIENGLASSSEWLRFALESGLVTMEQVDKSYSWKSLDYKTCSNITEQTDNSEAVSKAEAEYNRAMKDIDAKDSMYDIQLKNIDTEHTALQTEYDSVKSVISKNIDRTFKFNQNG